MSQIKVTVRHEVGLHARPAAQFVQLAASFPCTLRVFNVTTRSVPVDAKSILGVLTLGVIQGHTIGIKAEGEQADEALAALQALVENNFTQ